MPPRVGASLDPIDESVNLQHGMGFVVKYRNNAINSMDLWLGIHVPNSIAPKILTTKPKKNTGPDTPAADRAYMFYMPGRNTYAWIERKCLHPLSELSPEEFHMDGRPHAPLYKTLYELIEEDENDLQFWLDMAAEERRVKGSTGKRPSLVMPNADGEENESDAEEESSDKEEQSPPAKRYPKETQVRPVNKKARTASLPDLTVDGEEIVQVYIGNDSDVVSADDESIETMVDEDHILGDALRIGRSYTLKNMKGPEDLSELIPRLGKQYKRACLFKLDKLARISILKLQVAWNVYCGAPQYPLFLDFIESIMTDLPPIPATRNVFVGHAAQAPPFGAPLASSLSSTQQQWIVDFLAETMKLYLATDLQRFLTFLEKYPWMQAAMYARRARFCDAHTADLSRLETALMEKAPLDETKIAQAQQEEQKGEQADENGALFCSQ